MLGLRNMTIEERVANILANKHVPPEKKCFCCHTKAVHEYWSGQYLFKLCNECFDLAKDGSVDESLNQICPRTSSSAHIMRGGLPTLGKRR
jgi:hypothetical protein